MRGKNSKRNYVKYLSIILFLAYITITNIYAGSDGYDAKVKFLPDGKLLDSMVEDILKSEKNIYCSIYMFKTTDNIYQKSTLIQEAMFKALENNVKVFIVMDIGKNDDITTEYNKETAEELIEKGATVVFDSPNVRTHTKLMVIDEKIVYIGSHNYTHSALKYNREATARIVSKEFAKEVINYIKSLVR